MAVPSEVSTVVYPGNKSAMIEYPVPFQALEAEHIKVGVRPVGDPFVQLPAWEYTVVAKPGGGWAVTTSDPVPAADTVVIWRELPVIQPVELPLAGRLPATAIEQALDRQTMQIQQLADDVDRCVRLDRSASAQGTFQVLPNTLLGLDGNGNWTNFDPDKVRELALIGGVDEGNPVATWATAGDRTTTAPAFLGQVGVQRSDKSLWVANSLTVGDWVKAYSDTDTSVKTVRTVEEFTAAVAAGGAIRIIGTITLTTPYDITKPMVIDGDIGAKLVLAMSTSYAFSVQASLIVRDLEVTSATRLAHRAFTIGGPRFVGTFMLQRCHIHNVGCAFNGDGGGASNIMPTIIIDQCRINAIGGAGYTGAGVGLFGAIAIAWNLGAVRLTNNIITDTWGNGIWIGDNGIKRIPPESVDNSAVVPNASAAGQVWIVGNWVRDYYRNGIEVFGCDWAVIAHNKIIGGNYGFIGGQIALSQAGNHGIVHGNYVRDYPGYGIEIVYKYNIVTGNVIDTCTGDRENPLLAMSIGGRDVTSKCLVANNHFINIVHKTHTHVCINLSQSTDITITGNRYTDCSIACDVQASSCDRITFTNNEHLYSAGASTVALKWTFAANSGTNHVVMNNVTRGIGTNPAAPWIKFGGGAGGYVNYTSGKQIAPADFLEVGATSNNLVIP